MSHFVVVVVFLFGHFFFVNIVDMLVNYLLLKGGLTDKVFVVYTNVSFISALHLHHMVE